MEEIKLIIEQYKKRLQILKNTKGLDIIADTRLRTKASCYRTIVSELERAFAKNTLASQEQLAAPAVSGCAFSVNKSYPRALHRDRYSVDYKFVQFEISTEKKISGEFDAELIKLVEKYCR